jgi:hypothetical protein
MSQAEMHDIRRADQSRQQQRDKEIRALQELTEDALQLLSPDAPIDSGAKMGASADAVRQALFYLAQVIEEEAETLSTHLPLCQT